MKIVSIKNIEREPGHIYYRRTYHCIIIVEISSKNVDLSVKFTIEMDPLGKKEIELDLEKGIPYPLLPLKKALIEYILKIDSEGILPC